MNLTHVYAHMHIDVIVHMCMCMCTYTCVHSMCSIRTYTCVHSCECACIPAREASWRRAFDPCTPLLFDLYHYLEQDGYFGLVPEKPILNEAGSIIVDGFDTRLIPRSFSCRYEYMSILDSEYACIQVSTHEHACIHVGKYECTHAYVHMHIESTGAHLHMHMHIWIHTLHTQT